MNLSILIPMYNSEKYIERCLNSIINQNIPESEYEIIIMDDGSTDSSRRLVEDYVQNYSNIFLYKDKNEGTYTTRNKLLKLAKGEYIYNIDADDYLAGNLLKPFLEVALQNRLDILGFDAKRTLEGEDFEIKNVVENLDAPNIIDGHRFILENPNHRNEVWWYFLRADFLKKNKLFFEKNEYNADVVFTIKLFLAAKRIAFFPVEVYRYFQSNDSLMRNTDLIKGKKLIQYLLQMVIDLNDLIKELENSTVPPDDSILNQLRERRDRFIRTLVIKLIKGKISTKEIDTVLEELKNHDVYPIKNYVIPEKKIIQHKLIKNVINKKYLVYLVSKFYTFNAVR